MTVMLAHRRLKQEDYKFEASLNYRIKLCLPYTKHTLLIILKFAGRWWHMPVIPALGRQRQADF